MKEFDKEKLLNLMMGIAPGRATAEQESNDEETFLKNFLPIPNYRHVLEPNILLIEGGRGAGKTELFRLLAISSGREALFESINITYLSINKTTWIAGYGRVGKTQKQFPSPDIVEKIMEKATNLEWRSFWLGLLLGVILQQKNFDIKSVLNEHIDESILYPLTNRLSFLSEWLPLVNQNIETINYALDQLDEKLIIMDNWLFITYDELDRLVFSYTALVLPIRELLALWLARSGRWEKIRPKIFLRSDILRQEFLGFPDASKLQGQQVKLEWKPAWLYQLLIKRLANSGQEMRDYLQTIPGLIIEGQNSLGWNVALKDELFQQLIEKMIGKYMGAGPRKGITYRWIPNHLQDAGSRIAPRSFLKLFALAANNPNNTLNFYTNDLRLLKPSDLQGALMETSEDRIKELADEEYPWLEALKGSLYNSRVPMSKENFLEVVKRTPWGDTAHKKPPSTKPEEILQYLVRIGVVEKRLDESINIPEIYLYGFKVKRHGGVKRPK